MSVVKWPNNGDINLANGSHKTWNIRERMIMESKIDEKKLGFATNTHCIYGGRLSWKGHRETKGREERK